MANKYVFEHGRDGEQVFYKEGVLRATNKDLITLAELVGIYLEPLQSYVQLLEDAQDTTRPFVAALIRDLEAAFEQLALFLENIGRIEFDKRPFHTEIYEMRFLPKRKDEAV